jgi:glycosyltransferase involved in cell wall biosynthesis
VTRMIVVDATPWGPEPSGAKRRGVEIVRRLAKILPKDVFEMHWARDGAGPPPELRLDNVVHATVEVSCRGGASRWLARRSDLLRRRKEAPFTHLLVDHGPVLPSRLVRTVVTIHDLRFRHGYGGAARRLYGRFRYGSVLRRAGAVVAVSTAVRDELVEAYKLDPWPILSRNAASAPFRRRPQTEVSAMQARLAVPGAYCLLVGRDEPRKALRGAGAAWADGLKAKGVALVCVGVESPPVEGARAIREASDDELAALYTGARFTIAPALHEGFDLPVAESLACGTPVVASDIPAHRAFLAEGAAGLIVAGRPRRSGKRRLWTWPEGAAALAADPPATVRGSPATWDDAASAVAQALAG